MKGLFWFILGILCGFLAGVALAHKVPVGTGQPVVFTRQMPCPDVAGGGTQNKPAPTSPPPLVVKGPTETILNGDETAAEDPFEKLNLVDMRALCSRAENNWLHHHVDSYFKKPTGEADKIEYAKDLFVQLKEPLKTGSWWRGETDFSTGEKIVHVDVMLKFYGSQESQATDAFKSNAVAKIAGPEELCYALSPYITVDGKMENSPFSMCGNPEHKKKDTFYISYNSFSDSKIAPAVSMVLFPFPTVKTAPLEYLTTVTGQWMQKTDFAWRPSTFEEWQELHDRYVQSFRDPKPAAPSPPAE